MWWPRAASLGLAFIAGEAGDWLAKWWGQPASLNGQVASSFSWWFFASSLSKWSAPSMLLSVVKWQNGGDWEWRWIMEVEWRWRWWKWCVVVEWVPCVSRISTVYTYNNAMQKYFMILWNITRWMMVFLNFYSSTVNISYGFLCHKNYLHGA